VIRLYGMSVGNGSYARVTRGVRGALERLGLLSGFVPIDALDEWGEYEGSEAPIAITVGPQTPSAVQCMNTMGVHRSRLALLPLNSTFAPEAMLAMADEEAATRAWHAAQSKGEHFVKLPGLAVTGWLTPSQWSAEQLQALTTAPVQVWQHGVSSAFRPDAEAADKRLEEWRQNRFTVLHLASTHRQRKSTKQLLVAWDFLVSRKTLREDARLLLYVNPTVDDGEIQMIIDDLPPEVAKTIQYEARSLNLDDDRMAELYRSCHLIAQPSRGEGFGMIPLEALASGVPVLATTCTGHSEFLTEETPGLSPVESGAMARIDDGPLAEAPLVNWLSVKHALKHAWQNYDLLLGQAQQNAATWQRDWSWDTVMAKWAKARGLV